MVLSIKPKSSFFDTNEEKYFNKFDDAIKNSSNLYFDLIIEIILITNFLSINLVL